MSKEGKEIKRTWLSSRYSGSFSGLSGFVKNRKKWKDAKLVEQELQKLEGFALHRPIRRKFRRNKIWAHYIDSIWGVDLADISKYARYNKPYRWILFVVDSFSKFLYTVPLKNKSAEEVIAAFKKVFRQAGRRPAMIHSDMGKEFTSKAFTDFLKENKVKRYSIYSIMKSAICERTIRTIMTRIQRYMTEKDTKSFIKKLPDFTASYNASYHRSIGRAPRDVTPETWQDVWKRLYSKYASQRGERKPKYKVGDYVRISREKALFEKGYTTNWSREIFQIRAVQNTIIPSYLLKDLDGEEITGAFYEEVSESHNERGNKILPTLKVLLRRSFLRPQTLKSRIQAKLQLRKILLPLRRREQMGPKMYPNSYNPKWFKGHQPEVHESIHHTLTSQANPPGILNNELVSTLPHPMDLGHPGQYEVALTSLRFTLEPPKPKEEVKVTAEIVNEIPAKKSKTEEPVAKSTDKLFPDYSPPKIQKIVIKKTNNEILEFMGSINKQLESHGVKVGYMIVDTPPAETKLHVTISHDLTEKNMFLYIPSELANLMGFRKTDFYIGKHLPEGLMRGGEFEKVSVGSEYELLLVTPTYTKNTVAITCPRFFMLYLFVTNKSTPTEFFGSISAEILKEGYTCNFDLTDPANCVIEVKTPEESPDDYIKLPDLLSSCLGFPMSKFTNGRHESKASLNMKAFDLIGDEFAILFRVAQPNPKYMLEPPSLDLDDIIDQINTTISPALQHLTEEIKFSYYKGTLVFHDDDYDDDEKVTVQLPEVVNVFLGFDEDQVFTNGTAVPLKADLVQEEDRKHDTDDGYVPFIPPPTTPDVPAKQVLVLTNLCRNQYYAGRPIPLLRELDMPISTEEDQSISFALNHLIYLPMYGSQLQTLRLKLCDEFLRPLKLKEGTATSAQLHIRLSF